MKKIGSFLLAALLSFGFFGCNVSENSSETQQTVGPNPALSSLKSGFSCVNELQFFEYQNCYKAEVNKDKRYITEGETSAKFTFKGLKTWTPKFDIMSETEYFGDNNFIKAQALTVDVFNPSEATHKIWLSFTTSEKGDKKVYQKYAEKEYDLKPGYNRVTLLIDRKVANAVCDMAHVEYVTFRFVNEDTPYDLYLDNLRVHYTEDEIQQNTKTFVEGELLLFNDLLDSFFVGTTREFCLPAILPTFSICRDSRFIVEGNGSLKVEFPKVAGSASKNTAGIVISETPFTRADWSDHDKIAFKCMYPFETNGRLSLRIRDANGVGYMYSPVNAEYPQKGVWQDMVIDLSVAVENGVDLSNLQKIEIFYGHRYDGLNDYAMYLDDFRWIKER